MLSGLSGEEAIKVHEERIKQIRKWLRNKNIRQWRRSLFLLKSVGEPMHTKDVAFSLGANYHSIYRVLKKLEVSNCVKSVKKNEGKTELIWTIKNQGRKEIERAQKNKIIPSFKII